MLRPAVRLYHDLTQILRLCLPGDSIPRPPRPACAACWRAPPTCRISRRSMPSLTETQAKVRKSFVRILERSAS